MWWWVLGFTYFCIALGLFICLLPGQFASALSYGHLFFICLIWPICLVIILGFDLYIMFGHFSDDPRAFEDIKSADPSPRKKKNV